MPGLLRALFFSALLAGCASQAPVELPSSPSPPVARPAKPLSEKRAPAKPVVAVDAENNVFFMAGTTTVDADGKQTLQRHAQRLKADAKLELMLIGHTDDQGSRSYQLAIAEQRLDAVFKLLRSLGVPARQLRRYPVGREMSIPGCSTAECRSSMRRVELVYQE